MSFHFGPSNIFALPFAVGVSSNAIFLCVGPLALKIIFAEGK